MIFINIFGVIVFIGILFLFSKNRKNIQWGSIVICLAVNFFLAWFMLKFSIGREILLLITDCLKWLLDKAYIGINFAFDDFVDLSKLGKGNWFFIALMPLLFIVPLFDILNYIGVMPLIIKVFGELLRIILRRPKFESFFSIEMMVLGNNDAIIVSRFQLSKMKPERILTIAMMSMSCITPAMVGAYVTMMPSIYILTAIPINIINSIIVTSILNPVIVPRNEDTVVKIAERGEKKEPFFSFLCDSVLSAGKLVLIICAIVIAFISLTAIINSLLGLINSNLSLENILGVIMFPFAWLMGLDAPTAFNFAQNIGLKLVTNEFVVMGKVTRDIIFYPPHYQAVLTVFVTSFANLGTAGMILACMKGILNKEQNEIISKQLGYMMLAGLFVSLLSAATAGIFVW
ncbi:MAG: NupC/NupG family nucleoside CNT transporter [Elusimicrobiota bacterium]|jgi:CNT family concentrative nucleoside transporter/purine nucleoside transport protein|nr:NupC/NupG family nucleoside CNT transporter [Elusimicrobiota bacterium]